MGYSPGAMQVVVVYTFVYISHTLGDMSASRAYLASLASLVQSLVFPVAVRTACGPRRNATKETCIGVDNIYTCVRVVFKGSIPLSWV